MHFRFQRITTVYPQVAGEFLRAHPRHDRLTYRQLYDQFVATRFAECDYHAVHMRRLGSAAENEFASIEPLQKKWAAENGIAYREATWFSDIAVAQVAAFQPEVLLLDDLYAMDRSIRRRLVGACRRPPVLVGWRAAPTNDYSQFDDLDLLLSSIPELVQHFRAAGVNAWLLHHGFERSVLAAIDPLLPRDIDFSFAGGLGVIHPQRAALIERLMDSTTLHVWGADASIRWKDRARWWLRRIGAPQKQASRMRSLALSYPGRVHGPVFGLDYYRLLARSKIVLNTHISCSTEHASNMRMFEATGMGACLMTDRKAKLAELFEPDVEVATYASPGECAEKVKYLIEHEDERAAIAEAGRRRTMADHTFAQRVESMVDLLREHSAAKAA